MLSELENLIWCEKYRPRKFEDLILESKSLIVNHLKNPKSIPSFIFYSSKPGTGKTSTAKIIINYLDCDCLSLNASDERGIDTIREKIKLFARALSSNPNTKRCIFLDEADGLTRQAQDSLRNLIETYSDNCFFILSCNDIAKIIEPIRSRCVIVNFEKPNKADIQARLEYICETENIQEKLFYDRDNIGKLINTYYPDIRNMITQLQEMSITKEPIKLGDEEFIPFLEAIKRKDISYIYDKVYSGSFNVLVFNKWFFSYLFNNFEKLGLDKTRRIALRLADTEKHWNLGANLEIIFISNLLEIVNIL